MKPLFMLFTQNKIACKYCLVLISTLCSISIFAQGSFTITKNGQFYHIGGSIAGAYDLIADIEKWVVDSDNDKDMRNTDPAGAPYTGSWETGTGNNTMYVKDNAYDYINASPASADSAYNIGAPSSSVINPVAGDIYIAKLRGGSDFCVIKIISMDPADNTCGCLNTGKISFEYKKDSGTQIVSVNPDSAYQGDALFVSISGQNTNFSQGSGTFSVWFNQGSATINSSFFNVNNDTLLDAWFNIPGNASIGFWDVNVNDDLDGILTKTNGFYINIKAPPSIISVSPDSAYLGDALLVTISGQNTNFTQGSVSVWFNQGSATINSSSFSVSNDTLLDAFFNIPTNAQTGYWDVNVYDDFDWIVTLLDGFKILCKTVTGAIIGPTNVNEFVTENYSVPFDLSSLYYWSVLGGNQVGGDITNSISIQWGTTGIGLITVVETDSMGCIGDTVSLSVNIGFIGLNENEPGLQTVHVYPNPLRNKLTITFPYKNTLYFVNVYDIHGKEVVRKIAPILNTNTYDLDLSQQKSGVYFVKITDNKSLTIIKKIVLE